MRKHSPRSQAPLVFVPLTCAVSRVWFGNILVPEAVAMYKGSSGTWKKNIKIMIMKIFFKDLSNYSCKADWIFELKIENGVLHTHTIINIITIVIITRVSKFSFNLFRQNFVQPMKMWTKAKTFVYFRKICSKFSRNSVEIFAKFVKLVRMEMEKFRFLSHKIWRKISQK